MTPRMLLTLGLSGVLAAILPAGSKSNPPPHACAAFFSAGQHPDFCTADSAGCRTVLQNYASLFRNNKELVKSLSPSNALLLAGRGTLTSGQPTCH